MWAGLSEVHHQRAVKTLNVVYDVTLRVVLVLKKLSNLLNNF